MTAKPCPFEAYREAFYCDLAPASAHPHVWAFRERMRTIPAVESTVWPTELYIRAYCSIPIEVVNNPSIVRRDASFFAASLAS